MGQMVAIINGDLIRSSALEVDERVRFHDWLASLPDRLKGEISRHSEYRVDSFRGDSWQLLVSEAGLSLRIALYLRGWLRANFGRLGLDARMGIGIGMQELSPDFRLASADGPAFRRSGSALEASYQASRLQVNIPTLLNGFAAESLQAVLTLVDEISGDWTAKQARAVLGALGGQTQAQIGAGWPHGGISQQAVGQHLDRAGWVSLLSAIGYYETWLPKLLSKELERG